jgi:hypothetical protein
LNGERGEIISYDSNKSRYTVKVSSGRSVSLKRDKVLFEIGTNVRLDGLKRMEDNGKIGRIERLDGERYEVRLEDGRVVRIKKENVLV